MPDLCENKTVEPANHMIRPQDHCIPPNRAFCRYPAPLLLSTRRRSLPRSWQVFPPPFFPASSFPLPYKPPRLRVGGWLCFISDFLFRGFWTNHRRSCIMTLKSVLRALKEIFPQIDLRILRAVAIEYSKDVDAAVDFIISDVLPIISEPAEISHASYAAFDEGQSCNEAGNYSHGEGRNEANIISYGDKMVEQKESSLSSVPENVKLEINLIAEHKSNTHTEPHPLDAILPQNCSNISSNIEVLDAKQDETVKSSDIGDLLQIFEAKGYALDVHSQELCKANVDGSVGASSDSAPIFFIQTFQENPDPMECEAAIKASSSPIPELEERSLGSLKDVAEFPDKCNFIVNCATPSTLINDEGTPLANEFSQAQCSKKLEQFTSSTGFQNDLELQEQGHLTTNVPGLCSHASESYSVSDGLQIAVLATQGGDISNTDFLSSFVRDAQDSKKTLVSALLSTIDMLKDVELHEEKAEVARKEASMAGQDILEKVENLRQMIVQAKVKNEKDAEEIYAEQTALASETCKLHSRVAKVSAETEKSLSVIEEIRQALDARLAAAKERQAAAENEKLEKENMVHMFLREQECVMDSIVQEAHRLQNEAEKNAKLREFLMDRAQILNIIQGEIAAACEDALSLKDTVQGCVPDKTLISSTTTTIVSTTTSLSGKNTLFNSDPPASEDSCLIDKEAKDHLLQCYALPDHKGHSDDDWEMLEDEAER